MSSKRQRDKKKVAYTSTKEWVDKSAGGGFTPTSLILPNGMSFYKWKLGKNLIDIMPFVAGKGNPGAKPGQVHWQRTYYTHKVPVADGSRSYCCSFRNWNKKCPICDILNQKVKQGEMTPDEAKEFGPKMRQLFLVIDRKEKDKGIQVLETAHFKSFGEKLKDQLDAADDDSPILDFFHLEDGLTLDIHCKEDKFAGRTYNNPAIIQFVPRKSQYDVSMLDDIPCLDDFPKELKYEELREIFLMGGDDVPKDDDEKNKKKPKSKAKDDYEDDDDDQDEDEDEDSDDGDEIVVGDTVTFMVKNKVKTGTVTKINKKNGVALVDIGKDRPLGVDLDELTKVEDDEDEEDEDGEEEDFDGEDEEDEDEGDDEDDEDEDGDDEDDEDEDEDEEDDEEDRPVKKKGKGKNKKPKKKKKKVEEDDEDDDFDDDEDFDDDDDE